MDFSQFTIQITFLATPGIVSFFVLRKLIGKSKKTGVEIFIEIFLLSILSYALYGFVISALSQLPCLGIQNNNFSLSNVLSNKITPQDILVASLLGFLLSYLITYGNRYNVINFIGQKIRATNKYGDEDLWHFFHNAPDKAKNYGWYYVRDHKLNLIYYGAITTWSESDRERELIITEVTVYKDAEDGNVVELYDAENIYICRDKYDITLEVPNVKEIKQGEHND